MPQELDMPLELQIRIKLQLFISEKELLVRVIFRLRLTLQLL